MNRPLRIQICSILDSNKFARLSQIELKFALKIYMALITTLSLLLYQQELTEPTPHALPRPTRIKFTC